MQCLKEEPLESFHFLEQTFEYLKIRLDGVECIFPAVLLIVKGVLATTITTNLDHKISNKDNFYVFWLGIHKTEKMVSQNFRTENHKTKP